MLVKIGKYDNIIKNAYLCFITVTGSIPLLVDN